MTYIVILRRFQTSGSINYDATEHQRCYRPPIGLLNFLRCWSDIQGALDTVSVYSIKINLLS